MYSTQSTGIIMLSRKNGYTNDFLQITNVDCCNVLYYYYFRNFALGLVCCVFVI